MKHFYTLLISILLLTASAVAQFSVSEVITDYGGLWKSGSMAINSTKPDNSHNLLAFTFNNKRYSTGVNDARLTTSGQSFIPSDFRALPMQSLSGTVNGNTKIGLGELLDGIGNGASDPRPENSIPKYLTDGVKGLDLGTCVANLPSGDMILPITNVKSTAINDGIPDLLITQIADAASGHFDRYQFLDINGNRVGNALDIVLNTILPVGNWTADFYEANTRPMDLKSGYIKTDRAVRLWAADFSSFGITPANSSQIAYFKIELNGTSDVAFVAYNDNTIDVQTSLLPVKLTYFNATAKKEGVQLNWQTTSETASKYFVIETSSTGQSFHSVDSVKAVGNSVSVQSYSHTLKSSVNGKLYLRLKMIDANGAFTYSNIALVDFGVSTQQLSAFPNPAVSYTRVNHSIATGHELIQLVNGQGAIIKQVSVQKGTMQSTIQFGIIPKGIYSVRWIDANGSKAIALSIQ
ncbi:MAG: T9SS type A sorting domain-containing protein [Chitinophagaceae bacterium]|nr:T9SS type A sorting domain-containing protein [Chitinophagaceae bacterium]